MRDPKSRESQEDSGAQFQKDVEAIYGVEEEEGEGEEDDEQEEEG